MMNLCRCGGFVPAGSSRCPNCRTKASRRSLRLLSLLAGAQAITACACYGSPPTTCLVTIPDGGMVATRRGVCPADCVTPVADGGDPTLDPLSPCFGL